MTTTATTTAATAESKPSLAPVPAALPGKPGSAMYITACLLRSIGYAELLLADIPADKFAFCPFKNMNHPAFIVGHLSLYPSRIFTLIGQPSPIAERPGWVELFQRGAACVDDAGRYPSKDELVGAFLEGYKQVVKVLPGVGDEVFARDNPLPGPIAQSFPKVGIAVNFLCNNHLMMHLGQISAWRRAIGLGSVM